MATNISFEAHDEPISEILFANRKYEIPRYQRPYAWDIDHVTEFWEDLSRNDEPYFLGSFIFNTEHESIDGYVDIIDGQQRMLTITILMAVLRDIALPINEDLGKLIQRQDIAIEDRNGNDLYRIRPSETLKKYFELHIQKIGHSISESRTTTNEEKKVKENYGFLFEQISSEISTIKNIDAKLQYLKSLRNKVAGLIAIQVEITKEEDAYEIFETTNARGLDLSVADLLKI